MIIIEGLERLATMSNTVLTVGNFDGVHRAHQQLLAESRRFRAMTGGQVVVLTFEPHPLTVVAPEKAPSRLTPLDEKLRLLDQRGADTVVVARSDNALLGMEAEPFVREILMCRFRPIHVVEGPSFGFGRGRNGTPQLLRAIASQYGCAVHIVEPVSVEVEPGRTLLVSSSLIRSLLSEGRVREAATCLGRPYTISAHVVHGDGRGRTLGFPTANLHVEDQLIPEDGVYAGMAMVADQTHLAAISIGRTPTFDGERRRVEVHLLDFDGDLYGRRIRVELNERIRDQKKFDSPESLIAQVHRDIEAVRLGPSLQPRYERTLSPESNLS